MWVVVSKGVVYGHFRNKKQAIKRKEELKTEGIETSVCKC